MTIEISVYTLAAHGTSIALSPDLCSRKVRQLADPVTIIAQSIQRDHILLL